MARIHKPAADIAVGDRLVLMADTEHEMVTEVLEITHTPEHEVAAGMPEITWAGIRASGTLSTDLDHNGEAPVILVEVDDE